MKVVSTIDSFKFHFRVEGDKKVRAAFVELMSDSIEEKKLRGKVVLHDGWQNISDTTLTLKYEKIENIKRMAQKAVEDTLREYNHKLEQAEKFEPPIMLKKDAYF